MEARPLPAFISKKLKDPSIHRRDSRSIYILRRTAVVPGLDEVRVAEKRVANTPRCRFGRPAKCKSQRRKWHPDLVMVGFWLPGWLEERPPLQSVFPGRNQAGATSCLCRARTSAALPLLASPGTVSCSTNSPTALALLLHVIRLPVGTRVLCITEAERTDGWFVAENGMGDCLFVPGHAIPPLLRQGQYPVIATAHLSRAKKPHYCLRRTGRPNRGSG